MFAVGLIFLFLRVGMHRTCCRPTFGGDACLATLQYVHVVDGHFALACFCLVDSPLLWILASALSGLLLGFLASFGLWLLYTQRITALYILILSLCFVAWHQIPAPLGFWLLARGFGFIWPLALHVESIMQNGIFRGATRLQRPCAMTDFRNSGATRGKWRQTFSGRKNHMKRWARNWSM